MCWELEPAVWKQFVMDTKPGSCVPRSGVPGLGTVTALSLPPALILEEIAIDCHNKETEQRLLQEAHDLHLSSLQLAKKAFGEFNVQTAKHYGNLGRLYQSMRKFKVRLYPSAKICKTAEICPCKGGVSTSTIPSSAGGCVLRKLVLYHSPQELCAKVICGDG